MIIHQALHGYRNGHNMLASSIHLPPKDDDLLKVLSDWSEYAGGVDGDSSYITAYPLPDSKLYAIGKTWYANEKERPGCVWTHTLLLDLSRLDTNFDFRSLMSLFRKPSDGEYELYGETISFPVSEADDTVWPVETSDLVRLMFLYVRLLEPTNDMFIVEQPSEYYQMLCLSFMQHLPTSILKNRSFSSGSGAGRMIFDRPCSLQFTSRAGSRLSNSPEIKALAITNFDDGVVSICSAMVKNKKDISPFIRLFDKDIDGDVAKLCAVGKLYAFLDDKQFTHVSDVTIDKLIHIIADAFPNVNEGNDVKAAFLGKNISNLFAKEEDVIFALGATPDGNSIDYSSINYSQRVDDIAHSSAREQYYYVLERLVECERLNSYGQVIIKNSINCLSVQDYVTLIKGHWRTYLSLVSMNPQMLANGLWVDLHEIQFNEVYELFSKESVHNFSAWEKLFLRILYNHSPISPTVWQGIVSNVNSIVADVMDYLNQSIRYDMDERLANYVSGNISGISSYLSHQSSISKVTKQFVLSRLDPKNPGVSETDSSSWQIIYDSIDIDNRSDCVYLFILSFNWKDNNSLRYLKKAYYPIYKSLQNSELEWSLWDRIVEYTERLFPWQEWDKCKKLRKGIVKYLREAGYPKDILTSFTPDSEMNEELMRIW